MNPQKLKHYNLTNLLFNVIIIVLLAYIVSQAFFRIDLTSEKRYTLTSTTKELLNKIDDNVIIRIYLSGDELPPGFKRLQNAVRELLDEYKIYTSKPFVYEFINPADTKDKEKQYRLYDKLSRKGLMPIELKERTEDGKMSQLLLFPGAIINYKGKETAINFLKNNQTNSSESNLNNSIEALEYEFSNALLKLNKRNRQKIAFTSGHAELHPIYVSDISRSLSEYYDVERIAISRETKNIEKYKLLIIADPKKKFDEDSKYVIDQYIMNGGNVFWLIDGVKTNVDSLLANNQTLALVNDLNITDQLFRYGARVNKNLIEDLQCAPIGLSVPSADGKAGIKLFPWQFFPMIVNHSDHVTTKYLNVLKTNFISPIDTVGESALIKKKFLLFSSKYTKTTPVPARINFDMINNIDESLYNSKPKPVAVLLEGIFPSVFQNRNVSQFTSTPQNYKKESSKAKMIIFADGDIIKNEVSPKGEQYPLGFDRFSQKTFTGNTEFIVNAVNYLCDDSGLMSIRDRELKMRLLNKGAIKKNKKTIQTGNVLIPILLVVIFAIVFYFIRQKKYAK